MTEPERASGDTPPVGTLMVYGSCVSRDTASFLPERFRVTRYVARQSLISGILGPAGVLTVPDSAPLSPFQRRMVQGDVAGTLRSDLEDGRRYAAIVWDLCDERLGVFRRPDGSYVTRSIDLLAAGLEGAAARDGEPIRFGTDAHLALWTEALGSWRRILRRNPPPCRPVLLDVPWARFDDRGVETARSFGVTAAEAYRLTRPYVSAAIAAPEFSVISLEPSEVVASSEHRWGSAPFHYTNGTYETLAAALIKQMESDLVRDR